MVTASPVYSSIAFAGGLSEELAKTLYDNFVWATAVSTVASGIDYAHTVTRDLRKAGS